MTKSDHICISAASDLVPSAVDLPDYRDMSRYSIITDKRPREIVLLRGSGCVWRKCAFCDYYHDRSHDIEANYQLNSSVLSQVTGQYGEVEVINSGSVFELDKNTLELIRSICQDKAIHTLHFESHWLWRKRIPQLRDYFAPIDLKMKLGLETFDFNMRENVWHKGIAEREPSAIADDFDEANLLVGVAGQTLSSIKSDIDIALKYFERICINVMCENTTCVKPDKDLISEFVRTLYPHLITDPHVDILIDNTDFGVGA